MLKCEQQESTLCYPHMKISSLDLAKNTFCTDCLNQLLYTMGGKKHKMELGVLYDYCSCLFFIS